MKKALAFGTLESRIYTIFTVMIFGAIFIMQLVSFRYTVNTVRASVLETDRALLNQLVEQIDVYITGMELVSRAIAGDDQIQAFLREPDSRNNADRERIQNQLRNYLQVRDDISDILVMGKNGQIISSDPSAELNPWNPLREEGWYIRALRGSDTTEVSTSYVQNLIAGRYSWVVSLSRGILDRETRESIGVLLVDLKFNRIKQLCQSLLVGRKGYNFIIDNQGNYVFHPSQQLVYSDIRSEPVDQLRPLLHDPENSTLTINDRYYMVRTSELTGWHVISVAHDSDIFTDWKYVQVSYTVIGLILFLIVGLATSRISAGITKPLRRLQDIMKSVDTGEFRLVGNLRATDEVRELARDYDIMVGRIRELINANNRSQEMKRKSDLKALQAQINPHFLYNTLDSIIWMGEMGQNREVVQMTSALSKLFRISISRGREFISIRDELAHVQSYLTIQEMRYRDKFRYTIDFDPDLYDQTTLKITLQPLVENAIYHGIKEVDYQGSIRITGRCRDDLIIMEVSDNGIGMNEQELSEMLEGIKTPLEERPSFSTQGMGVRNIHERIRLYFGEEYGLQCRSRPGEGTTITVRIPASTEIPL